MLSELRVWSLVAITGVIWLTLIVAGAVTGNLAAFSIIADALPLLLLVAYAFERRGWRAQWLHPRPVETPVVIGTWRGELQSLWEDAAGKPPAPKPVYLVVRQTLTTVSVRLLSDEATSDQIAGGIARAESGYPAIAYNYRNKPGVELRHTTSNVHYGGAMLEIVGDPATGLEGEYWTERKSKGKLIFREHAPQIAQTFLQAEALTYGPPRPLGVLE
jgi:hypothetical protein